MHEIISKLRFCAVFVWAAADQSSTDWAVCTQQRLTSHSSGSRAAEVRVPFGLQGSPASRLLIATFSPNVPGAEKGMPFWPLLILFPRGSTLVT